MRSIALRPPAVLMPLVIAAASAALAMFLLRKPLQAVAVAYVIGFVAVVWSRPHLALLLIFAGAPFQNDLSGNGLVKFSIAEINLILTFALFLAQNTIRKRGLPVSPIAIPVFLYLAVCLYASALSWRENTSLISLVQMVLYLVVAVMVFSAFAPRAEDLRWALYGFVCVCAFLAVVAIGSGTNYYLGLHKNGAGASLACAVIVSAELWCAATDNTRRLLLAAAMALTSVGLILSLSRGAWLGACSGLLVIVALRQPWKLFLRFGLLLIPILALCWRTLPEEQRAYATDFRPQSYNIRARYDSMDLARTHFQKNPWFGDGVGLRKEYDANSIIWLTLAETGIAGLAALLWIHLAFFRMICSTQRRMPRTHPLYSVLAIGGALVVCKLAHGCVDQYWSRGQSMITWAAVGMAIAAVYAARGPIGAVRRAG